MNKLLAPSHQRKTGVRQRCAPEGKPLPQAAVAASLNDPDRALPSLSISVDGPPLATVRAPGADVGEIERLYAALGQATPASSPRTFKLLDSSMRKISQKVIEEAGEVALEAVKHHPTGVVRESADLIYHLVVLWRRARIEPTEIWEEMRARAEAFGIAEKLPKTLGRDPAVANQIRSTRKDQEG